MAKFYIEAGGEWNTMTKAEHEMREKIVAIMAKYTTSFSRCHGCGSDEGMEEDDYEEAADSIMEAFTMVEKVPYAEYTGE